MQALVSTTDSLLPWEREAVGRLFVAARQYLVFAYTLKQFQTRHE